MHKRKLVMQLTNRLKEPRRFIYVITGPRQTGKTTAVLQTLEDIHIPHHFISADDPEVISPQWLHNEWDKARVLQKQTGSQIIFAIDEIQKIQNWSAVVKLLWDEDTRKKLPVKVILLGSSSLLIQKGLNESMAGRFEVLFSPHWEYNECKKVFNYNLDDFLFFGGYPGAAALKNDIERWVRYIGTSIVEPVISRDIVQMEEIRKPALLRSLFTLGASYSAQELSYTKILGQLHDAGNTVTLAHYLELLNNENILCGLQKYSLNKIRVKQSSPRFLVYDTSLLIWAAGASRRKFLEMPDYKGRLIESAIGAYLLARGKEEGFSVYWWREREKEVDFVIERGTTALTAIEVKSGIIKHTGGSMEFKKLFPHAYCITAGSHDCGIEDFLSGKVPLFKDF
ncbi:MAG: ATP-binding protein [Treponema sp.]|nr:ATP-binding protein [Treponema sp.]